MNMRCRIAVLVCLLGACNHAGSGKPDGTDAESATVTIAQGALRGIVDDGARAFLGIPYAAAPVGELRWRPPIPAASWQGVRDASQFGASCMQKLTPGGRVPWTHEYLVQNQISEDCLFLNVWTPPARGDTPYPVMVWIHGGAFVEGSASVPIYNGAALARQGVIVVGINYRLGALGFLAHPELSMEGGGSSGNYALYDMIAALRWVQDNIAAFGGDPMQVTIAGQSAGASAAHQLIAAPQARGLFTRAIAQSGSGRGRAPILLADAEQMGLAFADKAGAALLAQLREVPAQMLLDIDVSVPERGLRFAPIVDGVLIPGDIRDLPPGTYADIPMLTGVTADEGSGLTRDYGQDSSERLAARLRTVFAAEADAARQFYPAATAAQAGASAKQVIRDRGIAAGWLWARQRAQQGSRQPVWLYLYAHPEPGPDADRYGAFHSSELPYVFQTLDAAPERSFTDADRDLSTMMSAYWANFVKTGDPNGAGLPSWPKLEPDDPLLLRLEPAPISQPVLTAEKRALFVRHVEAGGQVDLY